MVIFLQGMAPAEGADVVVAEAGEEAEGDVVVVVGIKRMRSLRSI
jgi:phage gp45-like